MDIRLLGPVAAFHGPDRIDLGPRRHRLVLAILALEANQAVPVERLVDLAWAGRAPRTAVHAIQVCVSALRSVLAGAGVPADGARIHRDGDAYVLRIAPGAVDAYRFHALMNRAAAADDDAERVTLLTEALELWSGPALSGAADADIQERLCRPLEEARLRAIEDRVDAELRLGRHRRVVAELASLVPAHPTRERMVAQYMTSLYRSGQASEALVAYRAVRERLAEEFGIDPGPTLQRLEVDILRNDPSLAAPVPPTAPVATPVAPVAPVAPPVAPVAPATPPVSPVATSAVAAPARSGPPEPRELPPDVSAFTGRQIELSELDRLLDAAAESRVMVISALSGTGGVGKTALAVHWAHRAAGRFRDGQLYIDLRGYAAGPPLPPSQALAYLLGSLGVAASDIPADLAERVARYRSVLAGRRLLVILDNAASAEQVRPLLPGGASCFVLVTSRDALAGLVARDGARRVRLDALPPVDAVDLLRSLAGDRIAAEPEAAVELADRCARLPLALRIAADLLSTRSGTPVADLARALADEGGRLDLLDAGADQDTAVRAVLSWSERHLPAPAARMLWLVGLHPGPDMDEGAAAALAGVSPDPARELLDGLTRASLLTPAAAGRWSMHDLLRAYAAERCATRVPEPEQRESLTRLFDFYLARAAVAMAAMYPARRPSRWALPGDEAGDHAALADPARALAWLDVERGNLVACAIHAADHGWPDHAARFGTTVANYLDLSSHNSDALTVHHRALEVARDNGDTEAEADALKGLAYTYCRTAEYSLSLQYNTLAVAAYQALGDRSGEALCRHTFVEVHAAMGDYAGATAECHELLALFREVGDRIGVGRALGSLGRIHAQQGRRETALDCYLRALDVFEELGDRPAAARTLDNIGLVLEHWGRLDEAADHFRRANEYARAGADRASEACTITDLGRIRHLQGHDDEALEHQGRALAIFREIGDRVGEAEVLIDLGNVLAVTSGPRAALSRHSRAFRMACEIGEPRLQAGALDALAGVLNSAGRRDSARRYWRYALELYVKMQAGEAETVRARLAELDNVAGAG